MITKHSLKFYWIFIAIFCLASTFSVQAQFAEKQQVGIMSNVRVFTVGDLDADGDLDVIGMNFVTGQNLEWFENTDGAGTFSEGKVISSTIVAGRGIDLGDLDGDNDLDIVVIGGNNANDSKIWWIENKGGANEWGIQRLINENINEGNMIKVVDLDKDGDMDLISTSRDDNKLAWYENTNGSALFTQRTITTGFSNPWTIETGDLDADGDLDIAVPGFFDLSAYWVENIDNTASFQRNYAGESIGNNPIKIALGDVNNDGHLDMVTGGFNSERIRLFYDDDGGFDEIENQVLVGEGFDGLSDLYLEDMDLDGDLDVLVCAERNGSKSLLWYENRLGISSFFPIEHIIAEGFDEGNFNSTSLTSRICFPADINGDGQMDVVAASYDKDRIYWFENLANPLVVNVETNSPLFCFGDMDGRIELDLSGGTEPYTITWENPDLMGATLENLPGGTYNVTVTDAEGDELIQSIVLEQGNEIVTNQSATICEGGSVTIGSIIYNSTGMYSIEFVAANGCDSILNLDLFVYPATFEDLDDVTIVEGDSLLLTTNSLYENIVWSDGQMGEEFLFVADDYGLGTHVITFTFIDTNGCEGSGEAEITVDMVNSIVGLNEAYDFKVYPNPVVGESLIIELPAFNPAGQEVQLWSADLRLLEKRSFSDQINTWPLESLAAGIYFIILKDEKQGNVVKKLVVL